MAGNQQAMLVSSANLQGSLYLTSPQKETHSNLRKIMLNNSNLGHVPQTKNVSCGAMARRRPDKKILGAPSLLISRTVNTGHWVSPAKGCPLKLLRLVVPKGNEETPGESKCASSPQKSKMASSIQPDLLVTASHIWCQSSNPQKGNIRIMFRDTKPEEAMGHVLRVLVKSGETPKLGPPLKLGREPPPNLHPNILCGSQTNHILSKPETKWVCV